MKFPHKWTNDWVDVEGGGGNGMVTCIRCGAQKRYRATSGHFRPNMASPWLTLTGECEKHPRFDAGVETPSDTWFKAGAAVAFGLIGMAEAIRQHEAERPNRDLARWYDQHIAEQQALSAAHMKYAQQTAQGLANSAVSLQQQQQAFNQRGPTLDEVIARDAWLQRERKK